MSATKVLAGPVLLILVACSGSDAGRRPEGSSGATGGAVGASGGETSLGGGGLTGLTGGANGSGGINGTGGITGTGGTNGAGGLGATGGTIASGGSPPGSGGASPGGGTASGGTSNPGAGETGRLVGMTDATNAVRSGVATTPAIPNVTWSPTIATMAQAYADQLASTTCTLVHSQTPGYGENLALFGGQAMTAADAVALWASEGACYTYSPIGSGELCSCSACGHYTQLVWRDTTQIGCGVATCTGGGAEIWVCNYYPPGNYIGQYPY